jgi:hypothetical protein
LPLAFAEQSHFARLVALALPVLVLVGFIVAGPIWIWRRSRDDEGTATLLGEHVPELRSSLLSAVQLQRDLGRNAGNFSTELAEAHIAEVARAALTLKLDRVLPRRPLRIGQAVLGAGMFVAVWCLVLAPLLMWNGLSSLFRTHVEQSVLHERLAEPITYDIELTYVYPAYTGLQSKTVQGTSGEITAPAGTEVKLKTRADRDVEKAFVVVGEQAQSLTVENKRDLTGSILVAAPGSYRFRFANAHGKVVAEGPPIPIAVEADQAPKVTLYSPTRELEVDPRGEVKLRYEAEDDYGVGEVDLVYRLGGSKTEQRITLSKEPTTPRRVSTDYVWSMPSLGLAAGDRVTYHLEAKDNDAVAGPKLGKSKEQVLRVYSEAEHHRLALQRVEHIWEQMIGILGDTIDRPDRTLLPPEKLGKVEGKPQTQTPPAGEAVDVAAAGAANDQHANELVTAMRETVVELRRDRASPKEIPRALSNIVTSLQDSTQALSESRTAFLRWSRNGNADLVTGRRLAHSTEEQIVELEKDTIYLEKLLDHRRIEDLLALSRDLSAKRRDLSDLLERYQKAPDEQTRAAIQADIARLKERIGELMQRMSELSRAISEEHLNSDALKQMEQNDSMLGELDKVQELLNQGKVDEAMKELQKLGDQMDQLQNGLHEAEGNFESRQDPELSKQFRQFNQQLESVAKQERAIEQESKALKQASQAEFQKRLEDKGAEFSAALRQKVAQSKKAVQDTANRSSIGHYQEDAQRAEESLDELDRALAGKDYDAAAEEAAMAMSLEQELSQDLKQEALRARRYPAWSTGDPQQLEQSAQQSEQALPPLQEVKKELDQLFPRGSQQLSEADRQKMQSLEKRQQGLQQQESELQQQMNEIGKKVPIFSPQMKGDMKSANQQMGQAQQSMSERDPAGSASHASEASNKLEHMQQAMKDAMKNGQGGSGGVMLPMPAGDEDGEPGDDQEGNNDRNLDDESVDLKQSDPAKSGEEYRKDLMDAMKQKAPKSYEDQVKRYYEEIVK